MIKHFKYLAYVLRHKWFVFVECVKTSFWLNEPSIIWLGLIHDWSKFRWSEWAPYVNHFYSKDAAKRHAGEPDPVFDQAWLYHQNRNRHHWQYWLSVDRKKEITAAEMPIKYVEEMLADWNGAARAKGQGGEYTPVWFDRVRDTLILERTTLRWVINAVDRLREK